MHQDQPGPDSPDRLEELLAEAVEADRSVANDVDPDLFLSRLQNRISRSGRQLTAVRLGVAALLLIGLLTWAFQDQLSLDEAPVVAPDPSLLLVLDVLEVLAPLEPATIALLDSSHFDTLEGFDGDVAALPLELLVADEEENR